MDYRKKQIVGLLLSLTSFSSYAQFTEQDLSNDDFWITKRSDSSENAIPWRQWATSKQPVYMANITPQEDSISLKYGFLVKYWTAEPEAMLDGEHFVEYTSYVDQDIMVPIISDLIGTPYEGLTCSALLDLGFVEPCQIPPLVDEGGFDENAFMGTCRVGYQQGQTTPYSSSTNTVQEAVSCVTRVLNAHIGSNSTLRFARWQCVNATTANIWLRYGTDPSNAWRDKFGSFVFADGECKVPEFTVSTDPDNSPPTEPPEETQVESDITDEELFDALKSTMGTNYFINHTTGKITYLSSSGLTGTAFSEDIHTRVVNGTFADASAMKVQPPVGSYEDDSYAGYYSSGSGTGGSTPGGGGDGGNGGGDGGDGGGDGVGEEGEGGFDCADNPGILACQDSGSFLDNLFGGLDDLIFGDGTFFNETTELEEVAFSPGTNSVFLPTGNSCPAPITKQVGIVPIVISYQPTCDVLSFLKPFVLAMAAFAAMYIMVGKT